MTTSTYAVRGDLIDDRLPVYDVVLTEHLVVDADPGTVWRAVRDLDLMRVHTPVVTGLMSLRTLPARLRGRPVPAPPELRLTGPDVLPGWCLLGEVPGRELAFGAVGRFWQPDIEWHDVPAEEFRDFDERGWGKIACHLLVRPDGPGRSVLSYECRTATTDRASRRQMARYWWLVRPFVGYIMRAVLRTVRDDARQAAYVAPAGIPE